MGARELQALLREIQNVRSPVQRMKLMALAWRTVARLTPDERKELGSKLGVRGFERILERLGPGPKGIAPAEVLRALEGADELDPSKLRGLVRGLRDPEQRKQLLRKGLDFLDRSLDEEEPVEIDADHEVVEEEETRAPEKATERTLTIEEIRPPEPVPAPAPEPVETSGAEPVEGPGGELAGASSVEAFAEPARVESTGVPSAAPVEAPTSGPVELAGAPEPARAGEIAVGEEESEPARRADRAEVAPPVPKPTPARVAVPVAVPLPFSVPTIPTVEALPEPAAVGGAAASLIARFRSLRRALDENGAMEIDAIRALLAEFPDGWARRRALMSLLRRGHPEKLDDAITVIEELERPTDRRWACATLIDSRELSDEDARRIAERFRFPSLTRRLKRQFGSEVVGE